MSYGVISMKPELVESKITELKALQTEITDAFPISTWMFGSQSEPQSTGYSADKMVNLNHELSIVAHKLNTLIGTTVGFFNSSIKAYRDADTQ